MAKAFLFALRCLDTKNLILEEKTMLASDAVNQVGFPLGHKVCLRLFEMSDAETLCKWMNDPRVTQFIKRNPPLSLAEEREWLENLPKRQNHKVFGIETLEDKRLIGSIGLHDISQHSGTATTGTVIGEPEYWGGGYGTDAKMVLLDYAFNVLNLRKIRSRVYNFNGRSLAYAAKCGYVEEGRLIQDYWKNGGYVDTVLLAVFRDKWLPLWEQYRNAKFENAK